MTKKNLVNTKRVRGRECLLNCTLLVISLLSACLLLELALRIHSGNWELKNFSGVFVGSINDTIAQSTDPAKFHALLGWTPNPGIRSLWGQEVHVLNNGIRSNHNQAETQFLSEPDTDFRILAVGDSFTFGVQVADHETWPAILERNTGKRVINGGVFGYGLDQSFLRAKELITAYSPALLIFSLIPDDIYRAELSVRTGVNKPFFMLDASGKLLLKNSPLTDSSPAQTSGDWFRKIGGYSFLLHSVVLRLMPNYWIEPGTSVRAHHHGSEVACLLMQKLGALAEEHDMDVVILVQYDTLALSSYLRKAERFTACVMHPALKVLDMRAPLQEMMTKDPSAYQALFNHVGGHMSPKGNAFIAEHLEAFLRLNAFID